MSSLVQLLHNYYQSVIKSELIYQQYTALCRDNDSKNEPDTQDNETSDDKTNSKPSTSSTSSSSSSKYIIDETLALQRQLRELTAELQNLKRKNEELKESVTNVKTTSESRITGYKKIIESLKSQVGADTAKGEVNGNSSTNGTTTDVEKGTREGSAHDKKRTSARLNLFGRPRGNILGDARGSGTRGNIFDDGESDSDSDTFDLYDSDDISSGAGTIFELRKGRSRSPESDKAQGLHDTDVPTTRSVSGSGGSGGSSSSSNNNNTKRRRLTRKRVEKQIQEEFLASSQATEGDNDNDREDSIVL